LSILQKNKGNILLLLPVRFIVSSPLLCDMLTCEATLDTHISAEALSKTQIPLAWRDYCAHLLPSLNACRQSSLYMPWACKEERTVWQKCQYDEYQRRMRILNKAREDKILEAKKSTQEELS
jgi:NADH dehydrogenase (ubiquinone) 1 beta subcomplex subunit 7